MKGKATSGQWAARCDSTHVSAASTIAARRRPTSGCRRIPSPTKQPTACNSGCAQHHMMNVYSGMMNCHDVERGAPMASKKTSSSSKKKLEATVKRLEAKLGRADAKAARWKQEAKQHESALASSQARIKKLSDELTQQRAAPQPTASRRAKQPSPTRGTSTRTRVSTDTRSSGPDASWTLAQLRAEARSRGLTGLSGKKKAEVLAALT